MKTVRRIINVILVVKGLGSSLYQQPPRRQVRLCNLCVNMTAIFAVMNTAEHYY